MTETSKQPVKLDPTPPPACARCAREYDVAHCACKPLSERVTEGIQSVDCYACGAHAGEPCKTPSGKVAKTPHTRRVDFASACNRVPTV